MNVVNFNNEGFTMSTGKFEDEWELLKSSYEYVFPTTKPKSPTLVESFLLQTYLNDYGYLPYRNTAF